MKIPLQISFRGMDRSDTVEAYVRERAAKLERFYESIIGCRISIEAPHKHHQKGNHYRARIDITVPNGELVVDRDPTQKSSHEDVYVAIRDAFDAARRRLEDYARKRRGDVKKHEVPHHGRIIALYPEMDYGTIETHDGREVYFHCNSLRNEQFGHLQEGDEVRFAEIMGDQGPKASTVYTIGKHHLVG